MYRRNITNRDGILVNRRMSLRISQRGAPRPQNRLLRRASALKTCVST